MLLSYLVTSRTRRKLLRLLWGATVEGSVSELGRRAEVSFAAAHRELLAMRAAGLARAQRAGVALVFSANRASPHAELVRRLAGGPGARPCAAARPVAEPGQAGSPGARTPGLAPERKPGPRLLPRAGWKARKRPWARGPCAAAARPPPGAGDTDHSRAC